MAVEKNLSNTYGVRLNERAILIAVIAIIVIVFLFIPGGIIDALRIVLFLVPIWLSALLLFGGWRLWLTYRRSAFIASQSYMLLEIKPPREVIKTPLAMEAVLSGIHLSPGESNWYKKFIVGVVRPWWSLEIVSLEGRVHFYIWTRTGFRRIVESQIYAQYPGAQVIEVPDYTRILSAKPEEWGIWGCDFVHTAEDAIPIKTYIEYGLDKVQKEVEQVDPLAHLIEFMASMKKGEYLWLQFIIRVHRGEKYKKTNEKGKPYTWKDEAKILVQKLRSETVGRVKYKDVFTGEIRETEGFPNPTKGQAEKIAAIERNVSKLGFDVGARGIYLARPNLFDPMAITGLTGIFKQFSSENWNSFRPNGWMTQYQDYPWEIGVKRLKQRTVRELVDAYRRRQFFYEPHDSTGDAMVMSTEELATIYHIPSHAVETSSLERVQSTTGAAPANLPI